MVPIEAFWILIKCLKQTSWLRMWRVWRQHSAPSAVCVCVCVEGLSVEGQAERSIVVVKVQEHRGTDGLPVSRGRPTASQRLKPFMSLSLQVARIQREREREKERE